MSAPSAVARLDTAAVDAAANALALDANQGRLDPAQAVDGLAVLVYRSRVPLEVAGLYFKSRVAPRGRQSVSDLADRLQELMLRRVTGATSTGVPADLDRIATGASFSGWMRNFLYRAAPSEMRNLGVEYRQTAVLSTDVAEQDGTGHVGRHGRAVEEERDARAAFDIAGSFQQRTSRTHHPAELLREQARHLCRYFELPEAGALSGAAQRMTMRAALSDGSGEVLRAVSCLADGEQPAGDLGGVVQALLSGWTADEVETLVNAPTKVLHTILRSGVEGRPPVRPTVAKEVRRRFYDLVGRGNRSWYLAQRTWAAWLAASTTLVGDDPARMRMKPDEQIATEQAAFVEAATRLISAGFTALPSPEAVSAWLMRCCDAAHDRSVGLEAAETVVLPTPRAPHSVKVSSYPAMTRTPPGGATSMVA